MLFLLSAAHAWVLARADRAPSWRVFLDALASDAGDIQGGTTGEGIQLGAMAGTVDLLQRCYTGLEVRGDVLYLNPLLPDELPRVRFPLTFRGHRLEIDVAYDRVVVRSRLASAPPVSITLRGHAHRLEAGPLLIHRIGPG